MSVPRVMVCVTRQKTCERLIKIGQKLVDGQKGTLNVVHVTKTGVNVFGNPDEGEALEYLFQVSKQAGAEMTVLRSDNILNTLLDFAKKNKITEIVMGESPDPNSSESIIHNMEYMLPGVKFNVIPSFHPHE
ncbi:MAG: universal stress protein UspA [Caldicoprobacterales bacterium]|jgi:K+-sensing histidine kinase KdpD|nr:universal stress protein UspA [Clostridiales bacterium]